MTEVIYLKSFERAKFKEDTIKKINTAIPFFPELETVYVGITKNKSCYACADGINSIVNFRYDIPTSYVTTFHELMHIVAHIENETPKTEEYCTIYAMARMLREVIDLEAEEVNVPYLGKGDRQLYQIPAICRHVVKVRESGYRAYLKLYKGLIGRLPEEHLKIYPSVNFLDQEILETFRILDKQKDSYS